MGKRERESYAGLCVDAGAIGLCGHCCHLPLVACMAKAARRNSSIGTATQSNDAVFQRRGNVYQANSRQRHYQEGAEETSRPTQADVLYAFLVQGVTRKATRSKYSWTIGRRGRVYEESAVDQ